MQRYSISQDLFTFTKTGISYAMLKNLLRGHQLILASGSPRRQKFFSDMDVDFTVRLKEVDEVYPESLKGSEITEYLAKLKAQPLTATLSTNEVLITSDTIVWFKDQALGKPDSLALSERSFTDVIGTNARSNNLCMSYNRRKPASYL